MTDPEHIAESTEASWLRRNISLPLVLTLLFLALLPGTIWWWRSQSIALQVEAAGGTFHVAGGPTTLRGRAINWLTGRPPEETHYVWFWDSTVNNTWFCKHREQLASLADLQLVVNDAPQITDEAIRCLRGLNNITGLSLAATSVTDAGLEDVATMSGLQWVDLSDTEISATGIEQLSSLPDLQHLQILETQLHGDDLAVLRQFPALSAATIDESLATESGIAALRACPQLVHLNLHNTRDETVSRLAGWIQLEGLYVRGPDVTDASIPALTSLTGLTSLYLRDTSVSDAGLTELRQALPGCEVVRSETPPLPTR